MGRRKGWGHPDEWRQIVEEQHDSGLSIDAYCRQEGVSRTSFYRWVRRLREGMAEPVADEGSEPVENKGSAPAPLPESAQPLFLPVSLKAAPVEIELPNGGLVRLPASVGQALLIEVVRAVGQLPRREARP